MLVYVRHGKTALNSLDRHEERLRGWLPVPLSAEGKDQAYAAAKRLARVLPGDPKSFTASDLHRALQTAGIVSAVLGLAFTPDSRVRDWNTGTLAGKKVDDVMPRLKALIKNPDDPAPGGEPLNEYLDRFVPAMREHVEAPGVHLVIGHARGTSVLQGIADETGGVGGTINPKFLLVRPDVHPGGILIIDKDWNISIDNPAEKDHEAT